MIPVSEIPQWGSFALVSYIPDPLGSFLHGLRQLLPGEDNSQPHITILPPRPLKLPVDGASHVALKVLAEFPAFDVELSKVRHFPGTNVLFLDVGRGSGQLYELHRTLSAGDLHHTEMFDFRPHLTLGGPVAPADLTLLRKKAEAAWRAAKCPNRFALDEVVGLWLSPDGPQGEWRRLWSHKLSSKETTAAHAAAAAATS
ncbi:MAG: 2'-5' RNA ligase family protein [Acidobacteriaceae bacterium]|nr:2'-5' RNA ligase family protein [Acidobacteriaceae bacterium]